MSKLNLVKCTSVGVENVGEEIRVAGWVNKRRDHGGLIFIDLRDRSGLLQVVFNNDFKDFATVESIRSEFVIEVVGVLRNRAEDAINSKLPTGFVELEGMEVIVHNKAKTPIFEISDDVNVDENIRLKHRYLDLRRPAMQSNLILRHQVTMAMRNYLDERGFLEIETPMLTKSTPEGARDYLVPSRVHKGKFFALPQSPQIFKQLLMVSGLDKYFQITRCFRDEDLRADRQPEFTQLDMEMSFMTKEEIMTLVTGMIGHIFKVTKGVELAPVFPEITYDLAMDKYGSDRPDLRFDIELHNMGEILKDTEFKVFRSVLDNGGLVKGINGKKCWDLLSRRDIDALTKFVNIYGAKGLAWIAITEEGITSTISKFLSEKELNDIIADLGGEVGDLLLFVADSPKVVHASLGALRCELAKKMGIIDENELNFVWVTDFPLFEYDEEEKRYSAIHHMFTAPNDEDLDILESDTLNVKSKAYDLVLNGIELGGGSIRIHREDLQNRIFDLIGLSQEEKEEKFGFLLDAFSYGAPPHGGIAFGLDRLIMLMNNRESIRDVIAFPKTKNASDLMSEAPGMVSEVQLEELALEIDIED